MLTDGEASWAVSQLLDTMKTKLINQETQNIPPHRETKLGLHEEHKVDDRTPEGRSKPRRIVRVLGK